MIYQNYITIEGRLTRKPELKTTSTGKILANFGICYNKPKKLSEPNDKGFYYDFEPNFFNLTAWNKIASQCENYEKGENVSISGCLCYDQWIDKTTNEKKSKVYILVSSIKKIVNEKLSSNYSKNYGDYSDKKEKINPYIDNSEPYIEDTKRFPDDIPF